MTVFTCVEDFRRVARRKVPRMFYDYVAAGAYAEETLRANRADLEKLKFRQRVLVDISARDTATTILGEPVALPLALGPVGSTGMQRGDGEILACLAAQAAGIPYTLSTNSICSIEAVAAAAEKPFWFQLYIMKDRGFARALIERAIEAKCSALVLTVDLQVLGQRHADIRNGLSVPLRIRLNNVLDMATKVGWGMSMLRTRHRSFGNLAGHVKRLDDVASQARWSSRQFDETLNWKDVEWVKSLWPGKLIIKGILDVEDARNTVAAGADALVVSNHGGRQLDGAPSTISVLPKIADAVGDRIEVMFDGGIRSGQDVMRALALGARSCLIGRAYAWAVGADGQRGVANAIEFIRKELSTTMALTGINRIDEIDRSVLVDG